MLSLTLRIVGSTWMTVPLASPSTPGPRTSPLFKPPLTANRSRRRWTVSINHTKTVVMHFCPSLAAVPPSPAIRRLRPLGTPAAELKGVYTSFILPKLIHASPAWSSSLSLTQHHQLEKVKKSALRIILGLAYSDYKSALFTLNLPRLSVRHEEALKMFVKGKH